MSVTTAAAISATPTTPPTTPPAMAPVWFELPLSLPAWLSGVVVAVLPDEVAEVDAVRMELPPLEDVAVRTLEV